MKKKEKKKKDHPARILSLYHDLMEYHESVKVKEK